MLQTVIYSIQNIIRFEQAKEGEFPKGIRVLIDLGALGEFNAFMISKENKKDPLISDEFLEKYKSLGIEESDKLEEDTVEEFNKEHYTKDDLRNMSKIAGAFYKCRSKGAASNADLDQNNTFYKRCLATFGLLMAHTYFVITILYDSQILTPQRNPKLFRILPGVAYPSIIIGFCGFVFYKNNKITKELDMKYTPLWKHLVEESAKAGKL